MWVILFLSLLTLFFAYVKWKHSYWSRRGIVGPQPTFFVGNVGPSLILKEHLGSLVTKWYNDYKDIPYVGYYKLLEPGIILRDPDLIKDVLVKDFNSFQENDIVFDEKNDPLLARNPFVCTGNDWKRGRNMLTPMFSASKIKNIFPQMEFACQNLLKYVKELPAKQDVEAKSLSAKYTTENTVKCSFSIDAKCFEKDKSEFRERGKKIFQPSSLAGLKFMIMPLLPKWISNCIPIPFLPSEIDTWFRAIVTDNRKSRQNVELPKEDFMQMLLNLGKKMDASDEELAGHSLSLFIEGFETSSTVLAFTLYEISKNPECQARLHDEIIEVLKKHENKFTYEALQDMHYLDGVVSETLRLNTVAMHAGKVCTQEYTLPKYGNQKDGVKIYPGTSVIIPVRGIHLNPSFYPDPEVFNPDRFSEEERKTRHKAHYLPFGEGPRMCIGMRFGLTQVKAAVVTIVREFKISLSPNHKPFEQDVKSALWHAKDGLLLNFAKR